MREICTSGSTRGVGGKGIASQQPPAAPTLPANCWILDLDAWSGKYFDRERARNRCAAREILQSSLPSSHTLMTERNGWLNLFFTTRSLRLLEAGRIWLDTRCWMLGTRIFRGFACDNSGNGQEVVLYRRHRGGLVGAIRFIGSCSIRSDGSERNGRTRWKRGANASSL
jgi:hypothetical protein